MEFEWEIIYKKGSNHFTGHTARAKVYGGWVLRNNDWDEDFGQCESMVFISDHNHDWTIDE